MRIWLFLLAVLLFIQCESNQHNRLDKNKIRLLILAGKNNHEWEKTTLQLAKMYDDCQKFQVQVTESPDTLSFETFSQFDVVVSNWTAWPEHDYRWPLETEEGLLKFIAQGGGFVLFHAASATFYDWPEYQELIGTTWGDSTRHGKITPHKIVIKDRSHPIIRGVSDFWITDELWVNATVNSTLNVLAESYSETTNQGRGTNEPVLHWNTYGKGRVFHNILGHNERAMKNTGWKTLMLRGTEWVAAGDVTIPVPNSLAAPLIERSASYAWQETDSTVALLNKGEIVWQYNFNTIKGKPFFHPVNVSYSTLTWLSPEDHPWHLGIWHSWKYINGVNYWEYDLSPGVAPFKFRGITEIRDIDIEKATDFSCRFILQIYYHEKGGPDLMQEQRVVSVSRPDENGQYKISYQMNLEALVDQVELNRTPLPHEENGKSWGGYAGLSMRFSQDFFEPSFINFGGSIDMAHGKAMPWKFYGLRDIQGKPVGAVIFTNPDNSNHPEHWFVTDYEDHPFYYFSPAPLFNDPKVLNRGDQLSFGYRIQLYQGKVNVDQLAADYASYLSEN